MVDPGDRHGDHYRQTTGRAHSRSDHAMDGAIAADPLGRERDRCLFEEHTRGGQFVPGPFGADKKPSVLVFMIVPGDVYASLPKPPSPK